jgi:radical SAM protein with 4Fe4S-binding SPASM domain
VIAEGPPVRSLCDDDLVTSAVSEHAAVVAALRRADATLVPLTVSLEVTTDCNIRCLHCYNFDRDEPKPAPSTCGGSTGRPPLSLDEIFAVLGSLRDAGCLFLGLTGGEVLSYPHIYDVLDRAQELGFAVQLLTNGTLLRPGAAARLARYRNLVGFSVSLYGATPEVHDAITQVAGSWRRTWNGIERVRALGVAVRLKFIIMRQNAHEVAAMRAAAEAGGYPYMVDFTITARHDGSRGSLATRIDDEQLVQLLRGPLRDTLGTAPRVPAREVHPCSCARGSCAVLANGDVTPCISVPWVAGNVRDRPFLEIWKSSPVFQRIRELRTADYATCAPCSNKAYCARPRGAAFTASGSYTGVDPFVCRTAAVKRQLVEGGARSE